METCNLSIWISFILMDNNLTAFSLLNYCPCKRIILSWLHEFFAILLHIINICCFALLVYLYNLILTTGSFLNCLAQKRRVSLVFEAYQLVFRVAGILPFIHWRVVFLVWMHSKYLLGIPFYQLISLLNAVRVLQRACFLVSILFAVVNVL